MAPDISYTRIPAIDDSSLRVTASVLLGHRQAIELRFNSLFAVAIHRLPGSLAACACDGER
ncbi:hypothetical protein PLANPX_3178 [Lacipirellula parvula]|uniref:Uncharacterized protein n=1 Tax=Lacipirellula parvula TaxID=2650471 RepID=A0A5K7XH01_9BACT|nr:hypothetical protein PLANPX_3178 [Lacipirellula parvula]